MLKLIKSEHITNTIIRVLIETLGESKVYETGKSIVPFLQKESTYIIGVSITALGKLRYKLAIDDIKRFLGDNRIIYSNSSETLAQSATEALRNIDFGPKPVAAPKSISHALAKLQETLAKK
jgi:hypothetical protein